MAQLKDLLVSGAAKFLNGINVVGDLTLTGNLLPATNNTYNLGSSTYRWANTWTNRAYIGTDSIDTTYNLYVKGISRLQGNSLLMGSVTVGNNASSINTSYDFAVTGTSYFSSTTTIAGATTITNTLQIGDSTTARQQTNYGYILPGKANTYNLGSADYRWAKIYIGTADSYGGTDQPIYWNAGVPTAIDILSTAYGGTGNTSFVGSRLIYTSSSTTLASSGHYASSSAIGINTTDAPGSGINLLVNGGISTTGTNGTITAAQLITANGGLTVASGKNITFNNLTSNRLLFLNSAILTAANHYINDTKVAINSTIVPDDNFYVDGNAYITDQVKRTGTSSSWRLGRDNALLRLTSANDYAPIISVKTAAGSWEQGHSTDSAYINKFILGYVTDTNYASGGNDILTTSFLFGAGGVFNAPYININNGTSENTAYKLYIKSDSSNSNNGSIDLEGGIYFYDKLAITTNSSNDTWLRINVIKNFSSGVYFGNSLIRTDNDLQVRGNAYLGYDSVDQYLQYNGEFKTDNHGTRFSLYTTAASGTEGTAGAQTVKFRVNPGLSGTNANATMYLDGTAHITGKTAIYTAITEGLQQSQLIVGSTDSAYNDSAGGSDAAIELWRGTNASWQILNTGGTLYFKNNYTTAAQSSYSQTSLILDYNTGAGSIPNLAIGQSARNTSYKLYVSGTSYLSGDTTIAGTLLPSVTTTYNLGSDSYKWSNIYATKFYGDLSGTSTYTTYLANNKSATNVTIGTSSWQPKTSTNYKYVWQQKWTTSDFTYTSSDGSTTGTVTDTADIGIWLSGSSTSNALTANLNIDGQIYAMGGFVGNLAGTINLTETNPTSGTIYYLPFSTGSGTALRYNNGIRYYTCEGTTSALGYSNIILGNNVANGTAANKFGVLQLYSSSTYYYQISGAKTLTAHKTYYLPAGADSGTTLVVSTSATAVGSTTQPVYINANNQVKATTYSLSATINAGTLGKLAYYSDTNAISNYSSTVGSNTKPVYINAGVPTVITSLSTTYGGTGLTSFTANRMLYTSSTSAIGQAHYVSGSKVAINSTSEPSYNFYVSGSLATSGSAKLSSTLAVTGATTLSSTLAISGKITSTRSDLALTHTHTKTISFGVGSSGNNRGLYNNDASAWLLYTADTNNLLRIPGGLVLASTAYGSSFPTTNLVTGRIFFKLV